MVEIAHANADQRVSRGYKGGTLKDKFPFLCGSRLVSGRVKYGGEPIS